MRKIKLTDMHVRKFFGVEFCQIEPDGRIYVEGPVLGYELSREEIYCCMLHMSARLGHEVFHDFPASRQTVRPLRSPRFYSVEQV